MKRLDLTGRKFGRLTWREEAAPYLACGQSYRRGVWDCSCGNAIIARNSEVVHGTTRSCGCLQREVVGNLRRTHGHSGNNRTYQSWLNMIQRCENPNHPGFHKWGGRGIKIFESWRMSFEMFLKDLGECPPRLTLEREDNSMGYFPGNVYWASRKIQARNTRTNRVITVRGVTGCLAELCEHFGISYGRVRARLRLNWPPELALLTQERRKLKTLLKSST